MNRFVYTPKVEAYIRLENQGKTVDISDDILSGTVQRRVNAMSTASLVLQNKNGRWLQDSNKIEAMDRIVIYLTRTQRTLVFSGYIDTAPFYQIFPSPVTINASCTLKLLQNTYFDPGLPYMQQFFSSHNINWLYDPASGTLTDTSGSFGNFDQNGGIGDAITAALTDIGGWPATAIDIVGLPNTFISSITQIMQQAAADQKSDFQKLVDRIDKLMGVTSPDSNPTTPVGGPAQPVTGNVLAAEAAKLASNAGFAGNDLVTAVAVAMAESNLRSDSWNYNQNGSYDLGLWQINTVHASDTIVGAGSGVSLPAPLGTKDQPLNVSNQPTYIKTFVQQMYDPVKNSQEAYRIYLSRGKTFNAWATYNPPTGGTPPYKAYMSQAQIAVQNIPFATTPILPGQSSTSVPNVPRATNAPTIADKVVSLALGEAAKKIHEIGQTNRGPEITKYQLVTGAIGQPWCASFVQWIFKEAGRPLTETNFTASVIEIQKTSDRLGWGATLPQPGDIITFHTDTSTTQDDHVGVVISVNGNQFTTVEGNTSDGVYQRPYTLDPTSQKFIHIPGVGSSLGYAGGTPVQSGTGDPSSASGPLTDKQVATIAAQSAWFTLQFQSNDVILSTSLTGKRALANDVPLLEWISNIVPAAGRVFMSKPNGDFYAFFPDYFGYFQRTPYFRIADIEITDLTIQRGDIDLVTHVFTTGSMFSTTGITMLDRISSMVASVEEEAFKYFINLKGDTDPTDPLGKKQAGFDPLAFLKKYGARPMAYDLPEVRHPILLWMAAWMKFTQQWAMQWTANASFTFLPEIFPGGLVGFGDRISMYVEDVTHSFSRDGGFSTTASLSAPASIDGSFDWMPRTGPDVVGFSDAIALERTKVDFSGSLGNT